jgi:hypothetical protein
VPILQRMVTALGLVCEVTEHKFVVEAGKIPRQSSANKGREFL